MTGGYGSRFDPVRLDLDDHLSEFDTDTFVSARSSFNADRFISTRSSINTEDCGDDDCQIVLSLSGKIDTASSQVTPSPPVRMKITPSLPVKMDITPSPPVKMEITPSPPEVTPSSHVRVEVGEPSATVTLTIEQQQVLDFVRARKNVFFSGPGGTGKTVVLQEILKFFRWKYHGAHSDYLRLGYACECFVCKMAITAPTGIAAIPIGGTTIHRAAGIGIPRRPRDFNRMWHKPIRLKWRNLSVLIIDEISMISAELLDYLEQTTRRIRTKEDDLPGQPFGGLQVIFSGDFFQLPPVEDKDTKTCMDQFLSRGLAFEAPAWDSQVEDHPLKTCFPSGLYHTTEQVMRLVSMTWFLFSCKHSTLILISLVSEVQKDDRFVNLLNGIRTGENRAAVEEIVANCSKRLRVANGIQPTVLYPTNDKADRFNKDKLEKLLSKEVIIDADEEVLTKEGLKAEEERDEDLRQVQEKILWAADFWKVCLAADQIKLKVGAQV